MTNAEYIRITSWIAVLEDIKVYYGGKTIDNIIQQLKARRKEAEK